MEELLTEYVRTEEIEIPSLKAAVESTQPAQLLRLLLTIKKGSYTAVMIAAIKDHIETCRVLLSPLRGVADELLFMKENYGRTALHLAALRGDECVEILLDIVSLRRKYGFAAEKDVFGNTAILLAAGCGRSNSIEVLLYNFSSLQRDCLLNMQNNNLETPLHLAAYNGNTTALNVVLQSVSPITVSSLLAIKNKICRTALESAYREEASELLMRWQRQSVAEGLSKKLEKQEAQLRKQGRQILDHERQYDEQKNQISELFSLTRSQQINMKQMEDFIERYEKQLETLMKQLDTQAKQPNTQTKSLDTPATQLDIQRKQLEKQAKQLEAQEKQLKTQAKQMEAQEKQQKTYAKQLRTQEKQFDTQMKQLVAQVQQLDAQVKPLDTQEVSPTIQQKASVSQRPEQRENIQQLTNQVSALEIVMQSLKGYTGYAANQISLDSHHNDFYAKVEALQKGLDEVKSRLDTSDAQQVRMLIKVTEISDELRGHISNTGVQVEEINREQQERTQERTREEGFIRSKLSSLQEQIFELCRLLGMDPQALLSRTAGSR